MIPIKTVKVYRDAIAVAVLQANRSVSVRGSVVDSVVSFKAVSRCIQALLASSTLIEVASSIVSVLKVVMQVELSLGSPASLLKLLALYIQALKFKLSSLFLLQAATYYLKWLLKLPLLRPLILIKRLLQLSLDRLRSSFVYFYKRQSSFLQTQHLAFSLLLVLQGRLLPQRLVFWS